MMEIQGIPMIFFILGTLFVALSFRLRKRIRLHFGIWVVLFILLNIAEKNPQALKSITNHALEIVSLSQLLFMQAFMIWACEFMIRMVTRRVKKIPDHMKAYKNFANNIFLPCAITLFRLQRILCSLVIIALLYYFFVYGYIYR